LEAALTAPTLLPEMTEELSSTLDRALSAHGEGGWTPEGAKAVVAVAGLIRRIVALMRDGADRLLTHGVDAQLIVGYAKPAVSLLGRSLAGYDGLEKRGVLASAPVGVVSAFGAVRADMAACRDFLSDALAKAAAPPGEVDWAKVGRARNAYAHGETRPVRGARKNVKAGGGE
jgi:hypothetical protein